MSKLLAGVDSMPFGYGSCQCTKCAYSLFPHYWATHLMADHMLHHLFLKVNHERSDDQLARLQSVYAHSSVLTVCKGYLAGSGVLQLV